MDGGVIEGGGTRNGGWKREEERRRRRRERERERMKKAEHLNYHLWSRFSSGSCHPRGQHEGQQRSSVIVETEKLILEQFH